MPRLAAEHVRTGGSAAWYARATSETDDRDENPLQRPQADDAGKRRERPEELQCAGRCEDGAGTLPA